MKSLYNILEGILDQDFDINLLTLEELVYAVYEKRRTKKQWDELTKAIDISFEKIPPRSCAQDYFGTIEVIPNDRRIDIRFMPINERAYGFGARRDLLEIKKGKIKRGGDGCHWLRDPAYAIPNTRDNQYFLNEIYENHK